MSMNRFVFYWHNGRSLGHTSRAGNLGRAILDVYGESASVLGITGASRGLELLPQRMDIVKLPSYLTFDTIGGALTQPILSITPHEHYYLRQKIIEETIINFNPDVWVIDYHPQGKDGELVPAILRSRHINKILGIRGIINDAPNTNMEFFSPTMCYYIRKNFKAIHVYTDPRIISIEDIYNIPESLLPLIKYTGYVSRKTEKNKAEIREDLGICANEKMLLISFGGGQGNENIWLILSNIFKTIASFFDRIVCVTGPYYNEISYNNLKSATPIKHFTLHKMLPNLHLWMKASDLFIGAGGYNTLSEIMANKVNSIIMPRQLSEKEQLIHGNLLAKQGLVRIIDAINFTESKIKQTIIEALENPIDLNSSVVNVNGAINNAQMMREL